MKRYEITAHKGNQVEYIKTFNEIEATIKAWELKMKGYENIKITVTE